MRVTAVRVVSVFASLVWNSGFHVAGAVPPEERDGFDLVVVPDIGDGGHGRGVAVLELEERGVEPEDERGVDPGAALALDLGRGVVERVEVVDEDVELAFGDVFPFVLFARWATGSANYSDHDRSGPG